MIQSLDQKKCTGCGVCVEICHMDVFRMKTVVDLTVSNSKGLPARKARAYIAYPQDCMTCFSCELKCPTGAVTVGFAPPAPPEVISSRTEGAR